MNAFVLLVALIAASPILVISYLFLLSVFALDVRLKKVKFIGLLLLVPRTLCVRLMGPPFVRKLMLFFLETVRSGFSVLGFLVGFHVVFAAKNLLAYFYFAVAMSF